MNRDHNAPPHLSHSTTRMRRFALAVLLTAVVVIIDQVSKAIALDVLSEQVRRPLIGDALGLQLAFNAGTILSIGSGSTWIFTALAAAAMPVAFIAATKATSTGWAITIGLLWGGALGNLIDRLFAPPGFGVGHVIDFLAYGDLFIGNLADIALAAGAALGLALAWQRSRRSRQQRPEDVEPQLSDHADDEEQANGDKREPRP